MAKYHDWTFGDAEALINVIGGSEVAREIKDGRRQFTVGELICPERSARPPLTGRVVKTITIPAYALSDFAEAVQLGNFDNTYTPSDGTRKFSACAIGLTKSVKIDLVEFDRNWQKDEAVAWGKENGNKKPMETAHLMGVAINLPNEQRERPIVELGSVCGGRVLCLGGNSSGWRSLVTLAVKSIENRYSLVGFVSE